MGRDVDMFFGGCTLAPTEDVAEVNTSGMVGLRKFLDQCCLCSTLSGQKKGIWIFREFQLQGRLNQIRDVRRPNTFSLLGGPIYRVENEKDISVATISLKFGVVNAVKHSHVFKDHFGITLEAGVPFKWYIKGKEAEKKVME